MNAQRRFSRSASFDAEGIWRHCLGIAAESWRPSGAHNELQNALARAEDVAEAFAIVAQYARGMGFEKCAYGLRVRVPFTKPLTLLISDYDPRWQQRYCDAGYVSIDPTVAHGVRSSMPLIWSDELFGPTPQLWSEARGFDLRVGWAQSCFDCTGAVGMLSVARSHEPLSHAEIEAREADVHWLASVAHQWLSAALRKGHGVKRQKLSVREIEVLRWMADGKTSLEVALLLRISVNTVNFHVKNAIAKLQVANKTAAVSNAIGLGLLE